MVSPIKIITQSRAFCNINYVALVKHIESIENKFRWPVTFDEMQKDLSRSWSKIDKQPTDYCLVWN